MRSEGHRMKTRTARWIAWSVWGLVLALMAGGLLLTYLNRSTVEPNIWSLYAVFMLSALSFASVGGLIARRHPENPISWLFCVMALAIGKVGADKMPPRRRAGGGQQNEISGGGQAPKARSFDE